MVAPPAGDGPTRARKRSDWPWWVVLGASVVMLIVAVSYAMTSDDAQRPGVTVASPATDAGSPPLPAVTVHVDAGALVVSAAHVVPTGGHLDPPDPRYV